MSRPCSAPVAPCRQSLVPVFLDAEHLPGPSLWCWLSSCCWLSPGSSVAWLPCLIQNCGLSSSLPWTINLLRAVAQQDLKRFQWSQGTSHACQRVSRTRLFVILIFPTCNCEHDGEIKEDYQRYCPQPHMNTAVIPTGSWGDSWVGGCLSRPGLNKQNHTSHSLCTNKIRKPICAGESWLPPLWSP